MAESTVCSQEPSSVSEFCTQTDSTDRAEGSLLTDFTFSDEAQPQTPSPASVDNKSQSSPDESVWEPAEAPQADPIVVGSSSQDPVGGIHVPMDGTLRLEEAEPPKKPDPACAAVLTAKDETTKRPISKARGPRTSLKRLNRISTPILLSFPAICLLATVILYVQATYEAEAKSGRGQPLSDLLKTDVSKTLTILRAAQGILSALISLALQNTFVILQWSQICPPNGIPYLNILALSPTTGALGTFGLIQSSAPRISAKMWALSR